MREIPYEAADLEAIRIYAARRVNASSVRAVASEIGIQHSTLHNFIHGAEPHPRIRSEVCAWYERETGDGRNAEAALTILTGYLPPEHRERAARALLAAAERAFVDAGLDVPAWIRDVRGE